VILGKEGDGTDNGDGDGGCHTWRGGKEVSSNHMRSISFPKLTLVVPVDSSHGLTLSPEFLQHKLSYYCTFSQRVCCTVELT